MKPEYIRKLENIPENKRRAFLFGDWSIFNYCDIKSSSGHCLNPPEHFFKFDGIDTQLCDQCFKSFLRGAFTGGVIPKISGHNYRPTAANRR